MCRRRSSINYPFHGRPEWWKRVERPLAALPQEVLSRYTHIYTRTGRIWQTAASDNLCCKLCSTFIMQLGPSKQMTLLEQQILQPERCWFFNRSPLIHFLSFYLPDSVPFYLSPSLSYNWIAVPIFKSQWRTHIYKNIPRLHSILTNQNEVYGAEHYSRDP
jgi:hypothetical protein